DNDGRHDIHSRITQKTWWVSHVAQFPTSVPFVLESRLNRLPVSVVQQEYSNITDLISAASQK
ncbi:MAG: sugar phosphate isomerase/epimerase, partial [Cyanobacteria bacterium J06629_18]